MPRAVFADPEKLTNSELSDRLRLFSIISGSISFFCGVTAIGLYFQNRRKSRYRTTTYPSTRLAIQIEFPSVNDASIDDAFFGGAVLPDVSPRFLDGDRTSVTDRPPSYSSLPINGLNRLSENIKAVDAS